MFRYRAGGKKGLFLSNCHIIINFDRAHKNPQLLKFIGEGAERDDRVNFNEDGVF